MSRAIHLLGENSSERTKGKKRFDGEKQLSRKMAEEPQKASSSSSSLQQPSPDKKPEDAEIKPQVRVFFFNSVRECTIKFPPFS